jgi:hypothetical protein
MHSCDITTCHEFVGYGLITKTIKGYDLVIGMNASKASHGRDHNLIRDGKAIFPHKYTMNFLLITNVWTTVFLLTLNRTK